jgi:hypothetical protein
MLYNQEDATLRRIQVEGALFSQKGELLSTVRAYASPILARSRIESLSPEKIQDIQREPKSLGAIKSRSKMNFTIAFVGPETQAARYFSLRIYAVDR